MSQLARLARFRARPREGRGLSWCPFRAGRSVFHHRSCGLRAADHTRCTQNDKCFRILDHLWQRQPGDEMHEAGFCAMQHFARFIFTAPATWASPAAPSSSWPAVPSSPLQGVPSCPLLADLFSLACRQHSVAILSERSCLRSWGVAGCDSRRPLLGHCGRTFLRRPVGTIGQLLSATGFGRGSETGRWRVGLTAVPSCPSQGGLSSWAAGLSWSACRHHEQPSSSDRSR